MKKLVSLLCAAALALSLAACGAESQSGGGEAKAAVYSLESATTFTFSDSGITADGSGVRVADSDCPTQDCVHTGTIARAGQSIVCLPAQVVVHLEGAASAGAPDVIVG